MKAVPAGPLRSIPQVGLGGATHLIRIEGLRGFAKTRNTFSHGT